MRVCSTSRCLCSHVGDPSESRSRFCDERPNREKMCPTAQHSTAQHSAQLGSSTEEQAARRRDGAGWEEASTSPPAFVATRVTQRRHPAGSRRHLSSAQHRCHCANTLLRQEEEIQGRTHPAQLPLRHTTRALFPHNSKVAT